MNPAVLQSDAALDEALTEHIEAEKAGVALCAPSSVPAGGRELRIAGFRVETLRDAARRPSFETMAVIVAAQLETGRVRAARAFRNTIGAGRAPSADPGEGYTGSTFRIDLAERLGIPLVPGPIALWMIARDGVTGPERILVESPPPQGIDDPEVAKFVAAWQRRAAVKPRGADPRTVWPEETVFGKHPRYRKGPESPVMPENGLAIHVNQTILAGSFRLNIARRHVVAEPLSGDPTTAVMPITLVIIDNDIPGPIVRHLRVPSFSTTDVKDGYFNLSLPSFSIRWQPGHTYFIYAVCGDTLSGPVIFSIASDSSHPT